MKPADTIRVINSTAGDVFLGAGYKISGGGYVDVFYEELFDNEGLRTNIDQLKASGIISVVYPISTSAIATFTICGTPSVIDNEDCRRYMPKGMIIRMITLTRVVAGDADIFTAEITVNGVARDTISIAQSGTSPVTKSVNIGIEAGDEVGINVTAIETGVPENYCLQLWTN